MIPRFADLRPVMLFMSLYLSPCLLLASASSSHPVLLPVFHCKLAAIPPSCSAVVVMLRSWYLHYSSQMLSVLWYVLPPVERPSANFLLFAFFLTGVSSSAASAFDCTNFPYCLVISSSSL